VTHVNFFTTDTVKTLMQVAGISPLMCKFETFTRPNGMVGMAIKAIGIVTDQPPQQISYAGTGLTYRLLQASLYDRILRMVRHPHLLKNSLP
jgi:hypothetical protein